jgi:hypothetical protein
MNEPIALSRLNKQGAARSQKISAPHNEYMTGEGANAVAFQFGYGSQDERGCRAALATSLQYPLPTFPVSHSQTTVSARYAILTDLTTCS